MNRLNRALSVAAALGLLATTIAGCSSEDSPSDTKASLTVVLPEEPLNLDPAVANSDRLPVTREVNEPLVKVNSDFEIEPWLAESFEQNKNVWTVKLRPDVKFSDGTEFNASTVVANFDPHIKDLIAFGYNFSEDLKVEAVDDLTVTFTDPAENPTLMRQLSQVGIWQPDAKTVGDEVGSRIGTGPYVVGDTKQGQFIKLKANPGYWGDKPEVKNVEYVFRKDASVRAGMIKSGEADIAYSLAPQGAAGIETLSETIPETPFFALDTQGDPLGDARVREAVNLAIDRKAIAEQIFGGGPIPASQLYPEGTVGYADDVEPWESDPARAKQLIAEAKADGVDVSKKVTIVGRNGIYLNDAEVVNAVASSLRDAGLTIEVQMLDVAAWADEFSRKDYPGARMMQGSAGSFLGDAAPPLFGYLCPDAPNALGDAFDTDKQLAKLCDEATKATGDDRATAFAAVAKYSHDVLKDPQAPVVHLSVLFGIRDDLKAEAGFLGPVAGIEIATVSVS